MSLIVGFNFGSYVLFGADTRVTSYTKNGPQWTDDHEKIQRTTSFSVADCRARMRCSTRSSIEFGCISRSA